jgi:transcriptional regulator with XRE-family HTH domain
MASVTMDAMPADGMSFGATLRMWRDRLSPLAVGLPAGTRRRARGLRREELSDLAGISVDYLVRLEQGRAETPSAQVVAALARALQLSDQERDHLYRVAGLHPPREGTIVDHIPPGMQRVLRRLGDTPVGVFSADWRLVWWNESWAALLGDPSLVPADERSLVRVHFPVAGYPGQIATHSVALENPEATDRAIVADLRRAAGRYPSDKRLASLIQRSLEGNPRFAQLWRDGAVSGHREDRKTIHHIGVGDITLDCDVLNDSDTDHKIVIYTAAPGSEDETKLRLTRVGGAHVMPTHEKT